MALPGLFIHCCPVLLGVGRIPRPACSPLGLAPCRLCWLRWCRQVSACSSSLPLRRSCPPRYNSHGTTLCCDCGTKVTSTPFSSVCVSGVFPLYICYPALCRERHAEIHARCSGNGRIKLVCPRIRSRFRCWPRVEQPPGRLCLATTIRAPRGGFYAFVLGILGM